jgi:cbb3-type cytochrome oxidase cytochrome c subunit
VKNGFSVFIAAFIALGASWCGFVLAPLLQLGTAKQTAVLVSGDTYPIQRTGDATLGLQVYRANDCAACHTEQIQQSGVAFDVVLTGLGKNPMAVRSAIQETCELIYKDNPKDKNLYDMLVEHLSPEQPFSPATILNSVTKTIADSASDKITAAGGKVETHLIPTGADISRGWGVRRSVAADFLYDSPVQLGSQRIGPDLADVGARLGNANWQLLHLYAPQSVVKNSAMPPFRFLFEIKKIDDAPSPEALNLPKEFAPPAGCEVVPKPEAKQLVAYLLSLRADAPLYEAPFTPAQVSTNAPAK